MRAWRFRVMVFTALALTACGGNDGATSPNNPASATSESTDSSESDATVGELRDAGEVRAEEAVLSDTYVIGEVASVDGVSIRIDELSVGGDDAGPWLVAETTVENRSGRDASVPYLEVRCAGQEKGGGWQADSTLTLGAALPSQTVDAGAVHLLVPGDGRFGEPRPVCDAPAVVRVVELRINFAIPDRIVDEINSADSGATESETDEPVSTLTPPPDLTSTTMVAAAYGGEDTDLLDIVAALNEAGVTCLDPIPEEPDPNAESFGMAPPEAEYHCTSPEVGEISIARWQDATTMRGAMRVAIELSAGFGQDVSDHSVLVLDARTLLGSNSEDVAQSDGVLGWLDRAQTAAGGEVKTFAEIIEG